MKNLIPAGLKSYILSAVQAGTSQNWKKYPVNCFNHYIASILLILVKNKFIFIDLQRR